MSSNLFVSRRALMSGVGALCVAASFRNAGAAEASDNQYLLNGTWRFALAKTEAEAEALSPFYARSFSGTGFQATPVPSNWAVLGYEEPVYRGFKDNQASEGFYIHDFTVPADWRGRRVLLHFGGVWSSAEVWLNGKPLGRHDSGYTSFAYDVTRSAEAGKVNRLAVRVRQVTREYKYDVYDDWTLGGIYRDVWLEAMPGKRWLDHVNVQTSFDDLYEDADLKIRVMVSDTHKGSLPGNYTSPGEPYEVRFTLSDAAGTQVYSRQLKIEAHPSTDRETRLTARIPRPSQWSAETPYLYNLKIELLEKGVVSHTRSERVGFREISTRDGVFRINGQAVKLRGVNRHDEHPDVGRATRREHWLEDLTLMKAANINYIRLAHYTHARGFIELCDEMGFYVGNEVSIGGAAQLIYDPSFNAAVFQRTYETVIRDINSPSIIYWSVGNEDALTHMHMSSVNMVKGLDPTRPVLLPWRAETWLPPEVDIIAPHYWKPQEYDELASRSTRPIITTEYTHAYANEGMGGLDSRWKALIKHPAGAGGAIWMWADQGLKSPIAKKGDISNDDHLRMIEEGWDGIVDSYRKPTRDYWEAQAVYAQAYPAVEAVSFLPGQETVQIPIQNEFDFTDLKAVTFDWSIREEGTELARGQGNISGQAHAQSVFELPLAALKTPRPDKTYVVWFTFRHNDGRHNDGREITKRAVELLNEAAVPLKVRAPVPLSVARAATLTVNAGESSFVFDPKTGLLVSAAIGGVPVITGAQPYLWHPLDANETYTMGAIWKTLPDLRHFTPTVRRFDLKEGSDAVTIEAVTDCVVDADNRFTATFRYRIGTDGRLAVSYSYDTQLKAPWLPVVGVALQSPASLGQLNWLGLGPYDAYPNKRLAPYLGLWGGKAGTTDVTGIKETRRIDRQNSAGAGFRVFSQGYIEHRTESADTVAVLSGVWGRPEKGRKADESIPQLETNTGQPFIGAFTIELRSFG
ncbi:MAG: glycoside hydrolase family 2 TIM barrel-domain containing protein [Asticcacaulis sp.]